MPARVTMLKFHIAPTDESTYFTSEQNNSRLEMNVFQTTINKMPLVTKVAYTLKAIIT